MDNTKTPKLETVEVAKDDFATLAVCAIRYCQGRRTYMPDLVREILLEHLEEISDKDLDVMISDCDYQRRFDLYGDEQTDKPGWLAWEKRLLEEKKRRVMRGK